jgi:hypothetical protein
VAIPEDHEEAGGDDGTPGEPAHAADSMAARAAAGEPRPESDQEAGEDEPPRRGRRGHGEEAGGERGEKDPSRDEAEDEEGAPGGLAGRGAHEAGDHAAHARDAAGEEEEPSRGQPDEDAAEDGPDEVGRSQGDSLAGHYPSSFCIIDAQTLQDYRFVRCRRRERT